ncbi:MAG: DNA-processing protein DprA [Anaerolineae bacterium]
MSKAHWLALASLPGVGGVTARKLLERFGDVEGIFAALPEELAEVPRVTPEIAQAIATTALEQREEEIYGLAEEEIDLLTWEDARFPKLLRLLPDAPLVLYLRGRLSRDDAYAVAIVGTRTPSARAVELAQWLAGGLAERGLTVVSGLALGIDTAAHVGALDAEGGRTLAVLGSGIRVIHPRENLELAERIANRGALLSEFPPNAPPRGPQLMARDRITSGLSRAVIVVEAGTKSGSLDTAARSRKQGRLVYAVPGSPGTDGLLKTEARRLEDDPAAIDLDDLAEVIRGHAVEATGRDAPVQPTLF